MLRPLLTAFHSAKLFAHAAHHESAGPNFFADHALLGELYGAYDGAFDELAEMMVGTGEPVNHINVYRAALEDWPGVTRAAEAAFAELEKREADIREKCAAANAGAELAVQNLLADFATASRQRSYKLAQRLGGGQ